MSLLDAMVRIRGAMADDPELRKAVIDVLRHEQELVGEDEDENARLHLSADIAHAQRAHAVGRLAGLGEAALLLCDIRDKNAPDDPGYMSRRIEELRRKLKENERE